MRLAEIYNKSNSQERFLKTLEKTDLNIYYRNGKIAGLQGDKKRYRLKTLGFSKERLEELNRSYKRINELNTIPKEHLGKNLGLEK